MNRPRLTTVVSLAEIVSALAIVVSLLYVGYEFRRSETLNSRDVETLLYNRMMEMDKLVVQTPELAGILLTATEDPTALTAPERLKFLAFEHIFYDSWEEAWYYHEEAILDHDAWVSWNAWFLADAQRRPRLGWTGNRRHYNGAFLAYIDGLLPGPLPAE